SPRRVAIAGDSAGGGLTFAALVSLRDAGLPLPACATPLSPWVDFEGTGDSITSRAALDPMVRQELDLQMGKAYVAGGDLRDPLAAPLYAELHGLPPLLIQVGEREILFDDSAQMADKAKRAGVDVTLREWKGMIHVWQIFASRLDEGQQAIEELGAFVRKHTS
ncbi:MAG: alpha/beta hydrolase fold domain-containing protein, partial [Myxococcales bacterium]|nr:alpha/beta hydrolase fold domain-containing protein [Myxococcales bacterium]